MCVSMHVYGNGYTLCPWHSGLEGFNVKTQINLNKLTKRWQELTAHFCSRRNWRKNTCRSNGSLEKREKMWSRVMDGLQET